VELDLEYRFLKMLVLQRLEIGWMLILIYALMDLIVDGEILGVN